MHDPEHGEHPNFQIVERAKPNETTWRKKIRAPWIVRAPAASRSGIYRQCKDTSRNHLLVSAQANGRAAGSRYSGFDKGRGDQVY
jgi:hypothetical protein